MRLVVSIVVIACSLLLSACFNQDPKLKLLPDDENRIVFNRDIRPILNKNCTGCHGGVGKQSGVSFISHEDVLARGHSGRLTVVPGDPDASGLIERVESTDPNLRMPYKAPPLKPQEIAMLRQWIAEGAHWQEHWAFEKPIKYQAPTLPDNSLVNNEIDQFIQAKLFDKGLKPSPKADKASLLRRVTLDLTGLPPTLEQIEHFVNDESSTAYDKYVDSLLASPRFGERWASLWLDLARYADTKGYTWDKYRATWPYRDWVIKAFNDNKSYKDFIIEQLAGDLLPNRSVDNLVATAFHRQTPANDEGGTDDEEFRVVSVMDRTATTWSVLNGITMNCVQCHAHPYDPINHDEYYKFYSFLNTTLDADKVNDTPHLKYASNPELRTTAFQLQEEMLALKQQIAKQGYEVYQAVNWQLLDIAEGKIDELAAVKLNRDYLQNKADKIEDKSTWKYKNTLEQVENLNKVIQQLADKPLVDLALKDGEVYETSEALAASAIYNLKTVTTINPSQKPPATITALRFMVQGLNPNTSPHTPEVGYKLSQAKVWHVKADGSEQALDFSSVIVGNSQVLAEQLPKLNQVYAARIKQHGDISRPLNKNDNMSSALALQAPHLFNPRWSVAVLAEPIALQAGEYLRIDAYRLNQKVRRLSIATTDDKIWSSVAKDEQRVAKITRYVELSKQLAQISTINMPVLYEQDAWDQRGTALFGRGNFLAKEGELLAPDTPKLFPVFDAKKRDRLAMANWFFKPEQPLTARVAVNRFWHALFGRGIVSTLEDFGSIGEPPSHPELLDWLALTLQNDMQWDIKALLKLIVTSHTYQQSAKITSQLGEQDPTNTWLARGPQQRLTAEMVRDQALLASGLMNRKMGGKGVMPPQPDNIWGRKGVTIKDWKNAHGEDRYRRAVYTFIKRQYYYPSFETFDMESRELSHARRIPTNTPLQALVTLNDPVYHEAAQALAKLMLNQYNGGLATNIATNTETNKETANNMPATTNGRVEIAINLGFKRLLSRNANQAEMKTLKHTLTLAEQEVGTGNDLASWTAIASVLLNLDIALTR
ncbi:hypothetical protein C2869_01215 [Saccharobesus litoralis]|uniref:Cytochrome c domain-containing protein n=1 Tax=Saccharobesus litoralis TaxID=2172099 RepID=A0A2S0VLS6_9ALTE|nr:PSD1 and planctomycete cytochrome C domain-containing protein [Saccharobesus litoralis]AWB65145.1 hypothetical protein C2869_01215 [Saccharobesus litoralis]